MHLDSTFGGLESDFLDTCPIKALLDGFASRYELCDHHGFKNRYGERTGKGTNYRFSDQTGVRLIIEPMTS